MRSFLSKRNVLGFLAGYFLIIGVVGGIPMAALFGGVSLYSAIYGE